MNEELQIDCSIGFYFCASKEIFLSFLINLYKHNKHSEFTF